MDRRDSPSTAAMTTLSMAVSVAVVMLDNIRTRAAQTWRHELYVDLPLSCIGFLGQSGEPALKVVATGSRVTWFTFIILAIEGQLGSERSKGVARGSPGRSF